MLKCIQHPCYVGHQQFSHCSTNIYILKVIFSSVRSLNDLYRVRNDCTMAQVKMPFEIWSVLILKVFWSMYITVCILVYSLIFK